MGWILDTILGPLWGFLKTLFQSKWFWAFLGAVVLAYGLYSAGERIGEARVREQWAQADADRVLASIKTRNADDTVSESVGKALSDDLSLMKDHTLTLIQEVPRYVTVEVDRKFPLPCGLVRLHDAAALGTNPDAVAACAGRSDEETAPVAASRFAFVIARNYAECRADQRRLIGWQEFYEGLRKNRQEK